MIFTFDSFVQLCIRLVLTGCSSFLVYGRPGPGPMIAHGPAGPGGRRRLAGGQVGRQAGGRCGRGGRAGQASGGGRAGWAGERVGRVDSSGGPSPLM